MTRSATHRESCRFSLSLRARLLVHITLAVGVALAIAGSAIVWLHHQDATRAAVRQLHGQTQILAQHLVAPLAFRDPHAANDVLATLSTDPNIAFARIHHADGSIFAIYTNDGRQFDFTSPPPRYGEAFAGGSLFLVQPVAMDGEEFGHIAVEYDLSETNRRTLNRAGVLLAVLAGALALGVSFAFRQARVLTRPVEELSRIARRVTEEENYALRARRMSNDEVGALTASFNRMLRRIESRDHALTEAREQLEARVAERTTELELQKQRAEDAAASLLESEQRNRVIVDTAIDSVITMNAAGIITGWNAQAERDFGWTADDAIGARLADLIIPAEHRAAHLAGVQRFLQEGTGGIVGQRVEVTAVHRNGTRFPVELAVNAVNTGNETFFSAFVRDITARNQHEQELLDARDAAEAASRAKSEFLANMSHEIRTPMTAILGFGDLLCDPSRSAADRETFIRTIRRNGRHLLQIINDVLDLSKIEAGHFDVELVDCSPCRVLADAASLMRVRAHEKGLDFAVEFATPMPETIYTDPMRVRQIAINLLSNAIKFTEEGSIRLVARLVGADTDSPALQFDVIDTGIGIAPDQIDRLFTPFSQADGGMSRRFGGTGLGLSISQHLAEMLDGGITVRSEPGKGSTFTVVISTGPLQGVAMIDHPTEAVALRRNGREHDGQADESPAPPSRGRVLLVEDGPDNQRLLTAILRRAGFDVTLAENGERGVEIALERDRKQQSFDVIMMDMQMPVLDGYSAATRLRNEGYEGTIIALTAHAMRGDRERCIRAGCDEYASKPVDPASLIEQVEQAVARGRHRSVPEESQP